jgi:selenocysteine-specific elongation factor
MRVIGTAGHVDHGKSTLVEALTGTHPDRLKEEQDREMTIDLGFAWMNLPGGEEVGIVDVPGHRDFVENMLAGVGGIDAALFVVAADEGVMPQTREHLAILDILQIQGGVVVLTKMDLFSRDDLASQEWLDLVEDDLRLVLQGTVLEDVPIIRVSARSGAGIKHLLQALVSALANKPSRPDLGRPRLPIDRVFTVAGFGTVVTGTLVDGQLHVGDEVEILGRGGRGRVRGLQTHKRKEDVAVPGSRTAVNVSGINVDQIVRGDVLAHPGDYQSTRRMDVRFRLLPDATQGIKHNTEVKFFVGAAEVIARLRLLGAEVLHPGDEGWLQLELREPVVVVRGDHYILRRPSPAETLGGGTVVDPHPKGRHKRFTKSVLSRLEALAQGSPADVVMESLLALGAAPLREVVARASLPQAAIEQAISDLQNESLLVSLEDGQANLSADSDKLVAAKGYWQQLASQVLQAVESYHQIFPLRRGMPREELKSRLKITARLFNAAIEKLSSEGRLEEEGPMVLLLGHEIRLNQMQERSVKDLLERFKSSPFTPPTIKETRAEVGEELYNALVDLKVLVPVSPEVVFRREDYEHMVAEVRRLLKKNETITAAEVRDHFDTSRRYALAFLEYLDKAGVTLRVGDVRRLKNG